MPRRTLRGQGQKRLELCYFPDMASKPDTPQQIADDAARYWSRSKGDEKTRELSHWIGHWATEAGWNVWGTDHFRFYEGLCEQTGTERPLRRMVEWGPGGGANAVHFCQEFEDFYGVDVSATNLQECGRQLEQRGLDRFHPVHIDSGPPAQVLDKIETPIDFFLSTAVYQHFPSKKYGAEVTRCASKMLRLGGLALIHIRYDDGSGRYEAQDRNYEKNAIFFTSYKVEDFARLVTRAGFDVVKVTLVPQENFGAYYFLRKRK